MNAVNSAFIQSIIRHLLVCLAMGAPVFCQLYHCARLFHYCIWISCCMNIFHEFMPPLLAPANPKHTLSIRHLIHTTVKHPQHKVFLCTYLPLSTYLLAAFKECWTKVDKYRNIPCCVGQCSSNNGLPQQNCATMKVFCLRGRKQQISGDFVIRRGSDPFKCVGGASQRSSGIS